MTIGYSFEDELNLPALLRPIAAAEDRIARLDERLRKSPVREGAASRALFREAIARMYLDGELVHLDDLVLLDDGSLTRMNSAELSSAYHILVHWRGAAAVPARSLLTAARPGEGERVLEARQSRPEYFFDPNWNEAERLTSWRNVLRATEELPATLGSALVMDAWLVLEPEQRGQWRAPLLGSLVLKAREKTREFMLPVSWGGQRHAFRWSSRLGLNERVLGILGWMQSAAEKMNEETNKLTLAHELLRRQLVKRRKNSKLPLLADLLVNKPVVSIPMAARTLKVTPEGARLMLRQMGSVPREMTGRSSYRVWGII